MGKPSAPSAAPPPGLPLHALKLSRKTLAPAELNEHMLLVPGVLSVSEAQRFIDAAEALGFEHQSSRGPAFGEAFRCAQPAVLVALACLQQQLERAVFAECAVHAATACPVPAPHTHLLPACRRDNHRISVHDAVLAQRLWADTGLKQVLAGVELDGLQPVGLNPQLRFYRCAVGATSAAAAAARP